MIENIFSPQTLNLASNLIVAVVGIVTAQYFWSKRQDTSLPRIIVHIGSVHGREKMSIVIKNDGYSDAENLIVSFPHREVQKIAYLKRNASTHELVFDKLNAERLYETGAKLVITYQTVWGKKRRRCWSILPVSDRKTGISYPAIGPKMQRGCRE